MLDKEDIGRTKFRVSVAGIVVDAVPVCGSAYDLPGIETGVIHLADDSGKNVGFVGLEYFNRTAKKL